MSEQNQRVSAAIAAVEYHLPDPIVTNDDLALENPDWCVEKVEEKTGIRQRHIAASGECASDLAVAAAQRLFDSGAARPAEIDLVLLCTQSPDYFLPTTACTLQHRLGIPTTAGALDFNLGCSGFVYGLGLAKGLIESGQARTVLLLTADTYSKFIHRQDRSVRTLFGDGAAATLIRALPVAGDSPFIEPVVWGTDGRGAPNLIVAGGAARCPGSRSADLPVDSARRADHLYMNGPEIFNFTVQAVPALVKEILRRHRASLADVDLFVFHQASKILLEYLRRKIGIPESRYCLALEDLGNTVSSSIPIALKRAYSSRMLKPGHTVLLAGFGVGYSWAGTLVRWCGFYDGVSAPGS